MKWFKKFEDFRKELEIETPIDETPETEIVDKEEEKDDEVSTSFIDPKGVIHIEDWDKY